jgi:hypothetical protein
MTQPFFELKYLSPREKRLVKHKGDLWAFRPNAVPSDVALQSKQLAD